MNSLLLVALLCSALLHHVLAEDGGLTMMAQLITGGTPPKTRSDAIHIIGAGLPKTGTKSFTAALKMLGYSVYDTVPAQSLGHFHVLRDIIVDNATGDVVRPYMEFYAASDQERRAKFSAWYASILEYGSSATMDSPMCFMTELLLHENPDAKVLLTKRVSGGGQGWIRSMTHTANAIAPLSGWPFSFFLDMDWVVDITMFTGRRKPNFGMWRPAWAPWINLCYTWEVNPDFKASGSMYDAHNDYIRNLVPPEQLLELTAADGWEPLCKFLDVPVDDCPSSKGIAFPRENSKQAMEVAYWVVRVIAVAYPFLAAVPLLVLFAVARCVRRCCCSAGGAAQDKSKADKKNR